MSGMASTRLDAFSGTLASGGDGDGGGQIPTIEDREHDGLARGIGHLGHLAASGPDACQWTSDVEGSWVFQNVTQCRPHAQRADP